MTYLMRYVLLLFPIIFISCVNDVDFDQAENLQINPVVEANAFYFAISSNQFVDNNGMAINTIQDSSEMKLFNDEFIKDNVKKIELLYEFTNAVDRSFTANLVFKDAADATVHNMTVPVQPGNSINPVITTHTETFETTTLDALKQAVKVDFSVVVGNGTNPVPANITALKLRSKATIYLTVNTGN